MPRLCAGLIFLAFLVALPATALVRLISHRLKAHDSPPVAGQVKFAARQVPNTGGIAIYLAIVLPILAGIRAVVAMDAGAPRPERTWLPEGFFPHIAGIQRQAPLALLLVGCLTILHVLVLIDDRGPLAPWLT